MSELIGLPKEDYEKLKAWSDAGVAIIDGTATGESLMQLAILVLRFQAYLSDALKAQRRAKKPISWASFNRS